MRAALGALCRWVGLGVGITVALAVVALWIWLPHWIDTSEVKNGLCRQLSQATGLIATVESLELRSLSGLEIEGRSLVLRAGPGQRPLLEIPRVGARLNWEEALRGQIAFHSISVHGMEISGNLLPTPGWQGAWRAEGLSRLLSTVGRIGFSDAHFTWEEHGRSIEVRGLRGDLRASAGDQRLVLQGEGQIWGAGGLWGTFQGKGYLSAEGTARITLKCDGVSLSPLVRTLLPSIEPLDVQGQLGLTLELDGNGQGGHCKATWDSRGLRVEWPGILGTPFDASHASGSLDGEWQDGIWSISRAEVQAGEFSLNGKIRMDRDGPRVVVTSGPFLFQKVIPYLGEGLVGHQLHTFFRDYLGPGEVLRTTFSFYPEEDGRAGGRRTLLMEMDFQKGSLSFDPHLQPLRDLGGTLVWQGDRVWFRDSRGTYRGHPFRSMEAKITEIGRVSLLQGRFVLDTNPREIEELFQAVAPKGTAQPLSSNLTGQCGLDLSLEKGFLRPGPAGYVARVRVGSVTGTLPDVPGAWKFSSGEVVATPQRLEIRDLRGAVEGSPWTLRGTIDGWVGGEPGLALEGECEVSGEDLHRVASGLLPGLEILPAGSTPVAFSLRREGREPLIGLTWDLSPAGMRYGTYWEKPPGQTLVAEARLLKAPTGAWRVVRGRVATGEGAVQLEGWLGGKPGERNWLQVWAKDYPVEGLTQRIPLLRGKVQGGKLDFQGEIYLGDEPHWMATLHPRQVSVPKDVLGHELVIRSGNLVLARGWSQADPLEMEIQGRTYTLRGRLRPFGQGFSVQGQLRGEEVDLDGWVFPPDEPGPARQGDPAAAFPLKRWLDALPSSEMEFEFKRLKLLDFVFRDVKGRFTTREGKVVMEKASGLLEGGRVAAEGFLGGDGEFWLSGGVDEAHAGSVLSILGFPEEIIEGALSMQAGVEGQLRGRRAGRHQGHVEIEVEKGVIRKFPVLANILSIMNLTQFLTGRLPDTSTEGMVFRKIHGSFSLHQGIARTEDFRVDSEAMVVTMVGDVDVIKKSCDFKVGVQPFVGFDRFINRLPVIRHYLAGPEKNVLATYFLVQGPLGNPSVTPVPFRSLGEGFMGIFKRFLQNPFQDLGKSPGYIEDRPPEPPSQ